MTHQRIMRADAFKQTREAVMICTDIAARGLDIPAVDVVLHYHVPKVFGFARGDLAVLVREGSPPPVLVRFLRCQGFGQGRLVRTSETHTSDDG